jgi:hypothetical protein
MVARRFEDLIVWQLAYKVQQGVFAFTSKPPASKDFKYCNQIRESSRSARKNISEGFGRYYPRSSLGSSATQTVPSTKRKTTYSKDTNQST